MYGAERVGKGSLPCTCRAAVEIGQQVFLGATVNTALPGCSGIPGKEGFCYPRDEGIKPAEVMGGCTASLSTPQLRSRVLWKEHAGDLADM